MKPPFNTLYRKILVVFLLLVLFLGVAEYKILNYSWHAASRTVEQQRQWKLAAEIAPLLRPFLEPKLDADGLRRRTNEIAQLNSQLDIFLLSSKGDVLFHLPITWAPIVRNRIEISAIEHFVSTPLPELPILGPDPRTASGEKIFSAARIAIGSESGYLYLPLERPSETGYRQTVSQLHTLVGGLATTVLLIGATSLTGVLFFFLLTARFRRITEGVANFTSGDLDSRIDDSGSDELGQLARQFNQMADTLVAKMEQLKDIDHDRREFAAQISHDLSGPLSSAHGYLETMVGKFEQFSEEEKRKYLGKSLQNIASLIHLVNELFELSKLEAPGFAVNREDFSLFELVHGAIASATMPEAEAENVTLSVDIDEGLPLVTADPELLERVLRNLVQNAVRYCPAGSKVTIAAKKLESRVRVSVEDNGPGISPEELPHIFEAFFRAGQVFEQRRPGTGLGLAIVQRILLAHGEQIQVECEPGSGTTFWFELPIADTAP